MKLQVFIATLCFAIGLSSCQQKSNKSVEPAQSRSILPPSTGHLSELVVVVSDELWRGEVGTLLKASFQENIQAIPQQEALFDLFAINSSEFSRIFKTHKNILWVSKGNSASIVRKDQKWAKNQLYVHVQGESETQLITSLQKNILDIRSWYLERNTKRRLSKLKIDSEKEIQSQISDAYQVELVIPKGYGVAEAEDSFIWLRRDHPKLNLISNIWLHIEDYKSPKQFSKKRLIQLRDSLGMVHVEGVKPHSFMTTELIYDPDYELVNEVPYTIVTKGLWTMVNDFLGGSYTAKVILDEENQRVIYIEGFLYCPNERKRSHIQELEAVISSLH
mgnify:FL=1